MLSGEWDSISACRIVVLCALCHLTGLCSIFAPSRSFPHQIRHTFANMVWQGGRRRIAAKTGTIKASPTKSAASGAGATPSPSSKQMSKTERRKFSKQEDKFASSVGFILEVDSKENSNYCKAQIGRHPELVPYLSSLFRRGTFEKMMQRDTDKQQLQDMEAKFGKALHSRINKLD